MAEKTLTIALMDPPYESANTTTAMRIIAAALKSRFTLTCSPTRAPSAFRLAIKVPMPIR